MVDIRHWQKQAAMAKSYYFKQHLHPNRQPAFCYYSIPWGNFFSCFMDNDFEQYPDKVRQYESLFRKLNRDVATKVFKTNFINLLPANQ